MEDYNILATSNKDDSEFIPRGGISGLAPQRRTGRWCFTAAAAALLFLVAISLVGTNSAHARSGHWVEQVPFVGGPAQLIGEIQDGEVAPETVAIVVFDLFVAVKALRGTYAAGVLIKKHWWKARLAWRVDRFLGRSSAGRYVRSKVLRPVLKWGIKKKAKVVAKAKIVANLAERGARESVGLLAGVAVAGYGHVAGATSSTVDSVLWVGGKGVDGGVHVAKAVSSLTVDSYDTAAGAIYSAYDRVVD